MSYFDISGKIGDLHHLKPEWPMYSFHRPAHSFWNGLAGALHDKGWSDDEIRVWLQSKYPRHLLDERDDELAALGAKMAEQIIAEGHRADVQRWVKEEQVYD